MSMNSAVEVAYTHKIAQCVDYFYNLTHNKTFNYGIRRLRHSNLMMDTAFALIELGHVVNIGSHGRPQYTWATDASPCDDLYKETRLKIAERNKREITEPLVLPMDKVVSLKPEVEGNVEEDVEYSSLSCFTSESLWEELKRRGYCIQDNQLCLMKILK